MDNPMRILMVSHGHPDFNPGGAEIASYRLHEALKEEGHTSVYFARHAETDLIHGGTPFGGTGRSGEVLFYSTMPDWFRFSQPDKARVWRDFREFLGKTKPNVVHFHHYFQLGLELLSEVRNFDPSIKIVVTLHEYMAICNNEGQMVKPTGDINSLAHPALCYESSPASCSRCFANKTPQDFFLRKQFIQSHFNVVDQFIAPSEFLAKRYVDWGIEESRICVIENLLDAKEKTAEPSENDGGSARKDTDSDRLNLAFYGQINRFKGIDVLLKAIDSLPKRERKRINLTINGSGLENQSQGFQEFVNSHLSKLAGSVSFRGRYTSAELPSMMAATDWIVIPSVWWENSPVVILEAKKYGVPVICSDIGGMAEKIVHGETGRHFSARREEALAEQIIWALNNKAEQANYAENIARAYLGRTPYHQHVELYQTLISDRSEDKHSHIQLARSA